MNRFILFPKYEKSDKSSDGCMGNLLLVSLRRIGVFFIVGGDRLVSDRLVSFLAF
jgi:hypothetical protein